ncbi:MAG: glycosyltransferase family 2 protein [Anaerolineales bacterium]|nr:glycosyltransferase family 2 protein [Anaerolineales bacterium]
MTPDTQTPPLLSIVVPTMNEAANIKTLLDRLQQALGGLLLEVIFVDDSRDNTPEVIRQLADAYPFEVRLIARPPERHNGLSGAVVEGFTAVRGDWMCVMDGDLQHPPEVVPQMLAQAQKAQADMVVGSRKANLLGPMGLSRFRSFTSQTLTILARALFPRSLKDVSDPLTGLFLVRRDKVLIERLRPNGFKILLEILVRCPHMRITEVYFDFGQRHGGQSKADFQEGMRFFRHLLDLRLTTHQRPLGRYLLVVLGTFLLDLLLLTTAVAFLNFPYWLGAIIAVELSQLWSFWGKERFAFGGHGDNPQEAETEPDGWRDRWRHFFWVNQLSLFGITLPLMVLLTSGLGVAYLLSFVLALGVATLTRYMFSDRWIWTRGLMMDQTRPPVYYRLHHFLTIESPVPLPDLAPFHTAEDIAAPDIRIRIDRHGTPRQLAGGVSYDERLGRLGFALTVLPGQNFTEVVVSPLVEHVPHLLFANVLEPLLRWMLVQQGVAYVRAGCVFALDGQGQKQGRLLLAPTRAERITAVFTAVQTGEGYVSHDVTLLTREGQAWGFPTPLTDQRLLEKPLVRRVGALLRRLTLPTVTLNSYAQRLFPPRQTAVATLVPVEKSTAVVTLTPLETSLAEAQSTQLQQHAASVYDFPLFTRLVQEVHTQQGETWLTSEREIILAGLTAHKHPAH